MKPNEISKSPLSEYSTSTRKIILNIINKGNAAHIGASFSLVEILCAVYRSIDVKKIKDHAPDRDRVILSKGHAAAGLYSTLFKFGLMSEKELATYNLNDSLLSGHVSHFIPCVEHSTGALGHGLPVALGMAIGLRSKKFNKSRVFVVLGDGEMHEGANWEAIMMAGHLKIPNLCVLVDNNHLSQIGRTEGCCTLDPLAKKFESFNFTTFEVDGHDDEAIFKIIEKTKGTTSPTAIVCQTIKGRGVSYMEDNNLWHYRTPKGEDYDKAIAELASPTGGRS